MKKLKSDKRVIRYKDEKNDDFANTKTSLSVTVDENYIYLSKSLFYRCFSFFLYFFIAIPFLFFYNHVLRGLRVKNREALKCLKKSGYLIYCNHTHHSDSWLAQVSVCRWKQTYIISNKDAIQIPGVSVLSKALGCLPVPDTVTALRNLNETIALLLKKKKAVAIFPEAHIWPYYTGLRPFPLTSFKFAAANKVPVVPLATTYKKRLILGNRRKPKPLVFVGKPIFYNEGLTEKENAKLMCEKTFDFIKEKTLLPHNYAFFKYIKIEDDNQKYN